MSIECSGEDLPLVTITTLTYNSNPEYLKEAIESVLIQTYPKIEYIISDDGSTIFHDELIRELLETKNRGNVIWKIIRHETNVGTVKNKNDAIRESHGEYIFGLAHDDVFYNSSVIMDRVKYHLSSKSLLSICCAEYVSLDHQTTMGIFPTENEILILKETSPFVLASKIAFKNPFLGATLAVSKTYFEKYGLYDEKYKLVEDAPLVYKCLTHNIPIGIQNLTGIKYRIDTLDKNNRYYVNPVYINDCIMLRREQLQTAIGSWKILMWIDLKRLVVKKTLLLKNKKKLLMVHNMIENLFRNIITR